MKSNQQPSYEESWKSFSKGDMISFRRIYSDFYPKLFNFGLLFLNKYEVENLIQDTFLYILQHRSNLSNIKNVKSYLFTSFRNRISKYAKQNRLVLSELSTDIFLEQDDDYISGLIHKTLTKLSKRERQVIKLRYFQDYGNKEIAKLLNIDYQTVRNTLHNAIKKMRLFFVEIELNY